MINTSNGLGNTLALLRLECTVSINKYPEYLTARPGDVVRTTGVLGLESASWFIDEVGHTGNGGSGEHVMTLGLSHVSSRAEFILGNTSWTDLTTNGIGRVAR